MDFFDKARAISASNPAVWQEMKRRELDERYREEAARRRAFDGDGSTRQTRGGKGGGGGDEGSKMDESGDGGKEGEGGEEGGAGGRKTPSSSRAVTKLVESEVGSLTTTAWLAGEMNVEKDSVDAKGGEVEEHASKEGGGAGNGSAPGGGASSIRRSNKGSTEGGTSGSRGGAAVRRAGGAVSASRAFRGGATRQSAEGKDSASVPSEGKVDTQGEHDDEGKRGGTDGASGGAAPRMFDAVFGPGPLGLALEKCGKGGAQVHLCAAGSAAEKLGTISLGDRLLTVSGIDVSSLSVDAVYDALGDAARPMTLGFETTVVAAGAAGGGGRGGSEGKSGSAAGDGSSGGGGGGEKAGGQDGPPPCPGYKKKGGMFGGSKCKNCGKPKKEHT